MPSDDEPSAPPEPHRGGWNGAQIEEAIALLWTIVWLLSMAAGAPVWLLWIIGIKALGDHGMAIWFAIGGR